MIEYLIELLKCLFYVFIYCITTVIIELIVLLFFKNKKALFKPLIIANVITNPILNLILPSIYLLCYKISNNAIVINSLEYGVLILFEVLVVISEAYILRCFTNLKLKVCYKYSIMFNIISFLFSFIGYFLVHIIKLVLLF